MNQKTSPLISVIMPVSTESEKHFTQAVESIINQDFTNFEFIIVLDNPQNLELKKNIRKYKHDKRVKIIINQHNQGLPYSLNKGIKIAKGKYIARMDGDDISLKTRLREELTYLEKNPSTDIVSTNRILIDKKGRRVGQLIYNKQVFNNLKKNIFTCEPSPIAHPSIMGKRRIFLENPYDERFFNSQDFDLWLRLLSKGIRFGFIEKPLIKFRIPDNEDYSKRIKKNRRYNTYSMKVLWKNLRNYYLNIFYYYFFVKIIIIKMVFILPEPILIKIIKMKNKG